MKNTRYEQPSIKVLALADPLMDVIEQSVSDETPVVDDGETTLDAKPMPSYSVWEE